MSLRGSYKNIIAVYNAASEDEKVEGAAWYGKAQGHAWEIGRQAMPDGWIIDGYVQVGDDGNAYDFHPNPVLWRIGAGVLAALSPRMPWGRNIELGMALVQGMDVRGLGKMIDKAKKVWAGRDPLSVLKGPKELAFYTNILYAGQCDAVTIDTHALAVYMGRKVNSKMYSKLSRKGEYERIERAYRRAAKELGVPVSTVQATTWVAWRNR